MSSTTRSPTIKRIHKEARELASSPAADFTASPLDDNIFEWHFTLRGPPSSPYADGIYHGRIVLPASYPLRPPSFRFLTPSGRFEPNREICLSISGHHEETWQPAWGIRTALVAIRAFMAGDAQGQVGGIDASAAVRKAFAKESGAWKCATCGGRSCQDMLAAGTAETAQEEAKVPEELSLIVKSDPGSAVSAENSSADSPAAVASDELQRSAASESAPEVSQTHPSPETRTQTQAQPQPPAPASANGERAAGDRPRTVQQRQQSTPANWIDAVIALLGVMLAMMVVRWIARRTI